MLVSRVEGWWCARNAREFRCLAGNLRFGRGIHSGGQDELSLTRNAREKVGVAGNPLRLAFRAGEGQWWAGRALPRSKRERGGGRGRKHPPTSEGGAVVGRISPPSLETREEGWAWQETPSDLRFKRGRGSGGQNELSLARNTRERVDVAENTLRLAFQAREGQWGQNQPSLARNERHQ